MSHVPTLISDLALILISASIVSLLFKRLKQPVVLGYIVAGILAGPHIHIFPTVTDTANIQTWADIGVVFLLFALGLDFSFKKLLHVGVTAVIATTTIVITMMCLGYLTGKSLGWSHMNSLFLGGMLCMSSTMIIIKVFDDMGLRNQSFTGIVLGILIVEDLFAVLLMVLLSTVAVSKHFEDVHMLESIFKLLAFLLFWFVTGIFLIPTFLKKAKSFLNDETLLVVSLGLCLGMVMLATKAGFSTALGAFVMGSILAETMEAEKIEHLVQPVKNLFGAIFFVSVGMMIDLPILGTYIFPIVIITLVVILGQVIFATSGVLLSGQSLKTAIQSGFSLAQVGEFSFIIAGLGLSLGVISNFLYPVIISVSVITIFITPYLIKLSEPTYKFVDRKIPASWQKYLNKNASGARPVNQENTWKKLLTDIFRMSFVYLLFSVMIVFLSFQYLVPLIKSHIEGMKGSVLSVVIIVLLLSPFLRAIMMKKNHSVEFEKLWNESKVNRGPLTFLIIIRIVICVGFIMFVVSKLLNATFGLTLSISAIVILIFLFSKGLKKQSILIERRFKKNLNARQDYNERQAPIKKKFVNHLLSRDLHLADFEVKQHYSIAGKTLKELNFRQRCGVNIVTIIRGDKRINVPGGEERIFPLDKVIVLGTDKQMLIFQRYIEEKGKKYQQEKEQKTDETPHEVTIEQLLIEENSPLIGKTIKNSGIRDKADCLVVGIERDNTSTMNPDIDLEFLANDVVWVVGEREKIYQLIEDTK